MKSRELWHTSGGIISFALQWVESVRSGDMGKLFPPSGLNPHEYISYISLKLFDIQFYFLYLSLDLGFLHPLSVSVSLSVSIFSFADAVCLLGAALRRGPVMLYVRALTWHLHLSKFPLPIAHHKTPFSLHSTCFLLFQKWLSSLLSEILPSVIYLSPCLRILGVPIPLTQ